mgnify:CR=1 FL=1|tara:strand:- start:22 stop:345 length:324 start_codon:yes stop_codon:yes gene_type:complete
MKNLYRHIFYLFLIMFTLSGCQSVKDGLTGKKRTNADEFLVEKKNPLVLPPDFSKLPQPETLSEKEKIIQKENDLETILRKQTTKTSKDTNSNKSLEKSILEKIKNN